MNAEFVLEKIKKCNGNDYEPTLGFSETDDNSSHIFIKDRWNIKYFLKDGKVYFISVHEEGQHE